MQKLVRMTDRSLLLGKQFVNDWFFFTNAYMLLIDLSLKGSLPKRLYNTSISAKCDSMVKWLIKFIWLFAKCVIPISYYLIYWLQIWKFVVDLDCRFHFRFGYNLLFLLVNFWATIRHVDPMENPLLLDSDLGESASVSWDALDSTSKANKHGIWTKNN